MKKKLAIIVLAVLCGLWMAGCEQPTSSETGNKPPPTTGGDGDVDSGTQGNPITPVTPTAANYIISGLSVRADGDPKPVTITPRAGSSSGARTIYYEGITSTVSRSADEDEPVGPVNPDDTIYPKSTTPPSGEGKYKVTFDVAAATGFNAANGLLAGTLNIKKAIPGSHFIIDFEETAWNSSGYGERTVMSEGLAWTVSGVVNPDANDRRDGEKSIRFRGQTGDDCRVELANYITGIKAIYFDYASYSSHNGGTIVLYYQLVNTINWVKVGEEVTVEAWGGSMETAEFDDIDQNGGVRFKIVREGDLADSPSFTSVNIDNIIVIGADASFDTIVPIDPTADDFTASGLAQIYDGDPKEVTISPKPGKSTGEITVYYEGTDGTSYTKSETAPSAAGKYTVTFDVAAATGFNAADGLSAGELVITAITDPHFIIDFEGSEWNGAITYTGTTNITSGGYEWAGNGYSQMEANDRRAGTRSIRLRGNNTDITNGVENRVELVDFITGGIKSIAFDYGSFSTHANGVIVLSYQVQGSSTWEEVGRFTALSWENAGQVMKTEKFDVNQTGSVRFKIWKVNANATQSVNIDNIVVTTYE